MAKSKLPAKRRPAAQPLSEIAEREPGTAAVVLRLHRRLLTTTNAHEARELLARLSAGPIQTGIVYLDIPSATPVKGWIATPALLKRIEEARALPYLRCEARDRLDNVDRTDEQIAREIFPEKMTGENPPDPSDVLKPAKRWATRIEKGLITFSSQDPAQAQFAPITQGSFSAAN